MSTCTLTQTVTQDVSVDAVRCDRCHATAIDYTEANFDLHEAARRGFKAPVVVESGPWLRMYAKPLVGVAENPTRLDFCAACTPLVLGVVQQARALVPEAPVSLEG